MTQGAVWIAMATSSIVLIVLLGAGLGVGLLLVFVVASMYNKLVHLRNRLKNAFAQIDVQLKRRYDLIPTLVETAKGYLKHERETLESVISLRNQASGAAQAAAANPENAAAMRNLLGAEGALTSALSRLMVVVEAYPDLKANQNMLQVSEELTSTENKLAFARQAFNDTVMVFNTYRESFPSNLVADTFNFTEAQSFELSLIHI